MAADGKWQLTINTPLGAQQSTLTISANGDSLSGTQGAATTPGSARGPAKMRRPSPRARCVPHTKQLGKR